MTPRLIDYEGYIVDVGDVVRHAHTGKRYIVEGFDTDHVLLNGEDVGDGNVHTSSLMFRLMFLKSFRHDL